MANYEIANKNNRVLMISCAFPPNAGSGVLRVMKFVKYLPENGWMPSVLTIGRKYGSKQDDSLLNEIDRDVPIYRTGMLSPLGFLLTIKKSGWKISNSIKGSTYAEGAKPEKNVLIKDDIRKTILDIFTTPDNYIGWYIPAIIRSLLIIRRYKIIYSTSPFPTAHFIALTIKIVTGKPWVTDFRDPWNPARPGLTKGRSIIEKWMLYKVLRYSDKIVVNTAYVKEIYESKYKIVVENKVAVITNGYDPDDFKDISVTGTDRSNCLTISHVGEFYEGKRTPDTFLLAIAALINEGKINKKDLKIVFVGGGEYSHSKELVKILNKTKLNDIVEMIDYVPHKESVKYMLESNILLLLQPDKTNSSQIPAKAFEYLRTGNTILTLAPPGATSDSIKGLSNGIVIDPNNIELIKGVLYKLYKDYKTGNLKKNTNYEEFNKFSRKYLTSVLAEKFNELCKKSDI